MRFKRVTKLLACVLSASMCTVPVFASGWQNLQAGGSGSYDVEVEVNSPVLNVMVPTSFDVKVNPLYDASDTTKKVGSYTVASKEFVISNNTSSNGQGVKLLCTATGTLTEKGQDVMVSYNKFTPQPGDTRKLIHLELTSSNSTTTTQSDNTYDNTVVQNTVPVTAYGSRLQVPVPEPTITSGRIASAGYGALAITGDANTAAEWGNKDVKVSFTYKIRAIQDSPMNNPTVAAKTATSANNLASGTGNVIAEASELTKATLGVGVTVVGVMIHSPENAFEGGADYPMTADKLKIEEVGAGYKITIPKEDAGITYLSTGKHLGKTQDLLIGLSDGRVVVSTLTVN